MHTLRLPFIRECPILTFVQIRTTQVFFTLELERRWRQFHGSTAEKGCSCVLVMCKWGPNQILSRKWHNYLICILLFIQEFKVSFRRSLYFPYNSVRKVKLKQTERTKITQSVSMADIDWNPLSLAPNYIP